MNQSIGVFGGTFDPPHIGHLFAAVSVAHELRLDKVLMIVANDPWQKSGVRRITPASQRFAMVELAVVATEQLVASRVELDRGGETYTADTLEQLHAGGPDAGHDGDDVELFLIVGSDAAAGLDTWKRPEVIRKLATTVVLDRPGRGAGGRPPQGWDCEVVKLPGLEVSGTRIRSMVSQGRPIDFLTPSAVVDYIKSHRLYLEQPL